MMVILYMSQMPIQIQIMKSNYQQIQETRDVLTTDGSGEFMDNATIEWAVRSYTSIITELPIGWTKQEINVAIWGGVAVDACWTTQPCMIMYIYDGQTFQAVGFTMA